MHIVCSAKVPLIFQLDGTFYYLFCASFATIWLMCAKMLLCSVASLLTLLQNMGGIGVVVGGYNGVFYSGSPMIIPPVIATMNSRNGLV